ncbi:alpha/beta hydrolase [Temperatibacter marinus]|uniref:Alpha/beta hydrolase n=1 Tax=Temperatibacter marinus TaxID=1456591 RepID=A0AA52EFP6_9PROT|nr:alpha/beta hydrolase [Temperatibacter marinus]WND03870.1 alpha/beta hydrolase [Temperatibacter marinus]
MIKPLSFFLLIIVSFTTGAEQTGEFSRAPVIIPLWPSGEIPNNKPHNLKEYEADCGGYICRYDITVPTMTIYHAQGDNSGKAVLILPGGGYEVEALLHEGYDVAKTLSGQGITAIVLKYRLPKKQAFHRPHQVPLQDVRQALKILRTRAPEYGIQGQIGLLGFSAGSHLATVASLWTDSDSDKNPDFSALIYGVTRLNVENQKWLENSLYHRPMTAHEIKANRLLNLVTENTVPAFLVHSMDDDVCHYSESTLYAEQLAKHKVPMEMHLFPKGGHGFGLGRAEDGTDQWIMLFANWVKRLR